jgi:hypothetical protein
LAAGEVLLCAGVLAIAVPIVLAVLPTVRHGPSPGDGHAVARQGRLGRKGE